MAKIKKGFFQSRLNWLGITAMLGGIYEFVSTHDVEFNTHSIFMFAFGLLVVILRAKTSQGISGF